jgi:hypothetical protein
MDRYEAKEKEERRQYGNKKGKTETKNIFFVSGSHNSSKNKCFEVNFLL